jgi:uncharacterized protein
MLFGSSGLLRVPSGDPRLGAAAAEARALYAGDDPGHDWSHVERVLASCTAIGGEVGADLGILLPAALLHDIVNHPKDDPRRPDSSREAAAAARPILVEAGYEEEEIARIAALIVEHSYTLGRPPSSLESAVLQDADRIDALGAVGILRAATCGGRLGAGYYHPADPFARRRELDDSRYTIDHFFTKLLDLPATLNTAPARREGERRVAIMRAFLDELALELGTDPAEEVRRPGPAARNPG